MSALKSFLVSRNFPENLPLDGEFHRFDRAGTLSGWFQGRILTLAGQAIVTARCGDWRTGEEHEYEESDKVSAEDFPKLLAEFEAFKLAEREQKHAQQLATAEECRVLWDRCIPMGNTEYLARKKIPLLRARLLPADPSTIVVPLFDTAGKLWSLQFIGVDGSKRFKSGGRIKGCHFWVDNKQPEPGEKGLIYVAEGFATAASVYLATGRPVACAFNAGNLGAVGQSLRERFPEARLVFAGDDDRWSQRPDGSAFNPGREKAQAAALLCGGEARFPEFPAAASAGAKPTDFSDLHLLCGLDLVREQLVAPTASGSGVEPTQGPDAGQAPAKKKKISEKQLADGLLKHFGDDILRQDKSLFLYDGKRWYEASLAHVDAIKNRINAMAGGVMGSRDVNSAYNTFFRYVPPVPEGVNLFNPNPFCANFLNGTLHMRQASDHTYKLDFAPHRREDFVINLLPYDYHGNTAVNAEFEAMLARLFEGEPDASDKIRSIGQMLGACLIPAFPHFFMLHGKPKTGKSTIIQIAEQLVSAENRCSVQPNAFHGFNMESMVGKLVNADPDINTQAPITDDQIKKVIDRRMFRIRRKGIADAYGFIPAIHIFGGQSIPPTLEGATGAHDRRWTFLGFNQVQGGTGLYDKEFWRWVWDQGPAGVLAFAVRGLEDLCRQRGHYLNPESGVAHMKVWQKLHDIVETFLEDASEGEIEDKNAKLIVQKDAEIARSQLWTIFESWMDKVSVPHAKRLSRNQFYEQLRQKGFKEHRTEEGRFFVGNASIDLPTAKF